MTTEMNRRSVLKSLAGIGVGAGAIFGSGAFTSVEASRTVSIKTSGDGDAQLSLDGSGEIMTTTAADGNGVQIKLEDHDINNDAVTRYDGAITVTNSGSQSRHFYVNDPNEESANSLGNGEALDFEIASSEGDRNKGDSLVAHSVSLDTGSPIDLDIVIDNTSSGGSVDNIPETIEFVADSTDNLS